MRGSFARSAAGRQVIVDKAIVGRVMVDRDLRRPPEMPDRVRIRPQGLSAHGLSCLIANVQLLEMSGITCIIDGGPIPTVQIVV